MKGEGWKGGVVQVIYDVKNYSFFLSLYISESLPVLHLCMSVCVRAKEHTTFLGCMFKYILFSITTTALHDYNRDKIFYLLQCKLLA